MGVPCFLRLWGTDEQTDLHALNNFSFSIHKVPCKTNSMSLGLVLLEHNCTTQVGTNTDADVWTLQSDSRLGILISINLYPCYLLSGGRCPAPWIVIKTSPLAPPVLLLAEFWTVPWIGEFWTVPWTFSKRIAVILDSLFLHFQLYFSLVPGHCLQWLVFVSL